MQSRGRGSSESWGRWRSRECPPPAARGSVHSSPGCCSRQTSPLRRWISSTRSRDDRPPAGAARSLKVYASRLRKLISHTGAEILRRGDGYELVLGPARLDAHVFQALTDAARRALATGDAVGARSRLVEALALWRGSALADVPGDPGAALDEFGSAPRRIWRRPAWRSVCTPSSRRRSSGWSTSSRCESALAPS